MTKKELTIINAQLTTSQQQYPLYLSAVSAGFPSPATDHIDQQLNLHDHIVKNPPATYFVKVVGESMKDAGIFPDDILVVDRSLEPQHESIVIAVIDSELTVKRLLKTKTGVTLKAENQQYKNITVSSEDELTIWGVVTTVIHKV